MDAEQGHSYDPQPPPPPLTLIMPFNSSAIAQTCYKFGSKVGQNVLIAMKLELDVMAPARCIYKVSKRYFKSC